MKDELLTMILSSCTVYNRATAAHIVHARCCCAYTSILKSSIVVVAALMNVYNDCRGLNLYTD